MKLLLIFLLFAPIVYLAFRQKKWYLFLAFAFVGILPEQLSVRLHNSLPLISATRVLILLVLSFWLWKKWKTRHFSSPKSLLIFLGINVIISFVNFRYGTGELNRIFLYVCERVLLIVAAADLIEDRSEFDRCIDFMILGCVALAVIGIVQTVLDYDIASVLHITETLSSVTLSDRMGLTRAYGTFNAITYGCYCAFVTLPIYYRLEKTGQLRYSIAFALNFIALICTFTRSAWLCVGGILLVLLFVRRWQLIRRLLTSAGLIILICAVLCFAQPKLFNAFIETGKSSINTILAVLPDSNRTPSSSLGNPSSPTTEHTKPGFDLSDDFGMNGEDPTYSRMAQWTAVEYMIQDGEFLFGYGYNALPEGRIFFFFDRWDAKWAPTTFLDVGLVALLMEGGFLGAFALLGLLCYLFVYALCKRGKGNGFDFYDVTIYTIPLFLLLNFLAAFMFDQIVWLFIGLFYAYRRLHRCGCLHSIGDGIDPPQP